MFGIGTFGDFVRSIEFQDQVRAEVMDDRLPFPGDQSKTPTPTTIRKDEAVAVLPAPKLLHRATA